MASKIEIAIGIIRDYSVNALFIQNVDCVERYNNMVNPYQHLNKEQFELLKEVLWKN